MYSSALYTCNLTREASLNCNINKHYMYNICRIVDYYEERMFIPMAQTDVELDQAVVDEIVEEAGRAWMLWFLAPVALVAVAGIVFFVVRRFFGSAE